MTVPQEILELVGRFDNNLDAYRSGTYNETQLRREFVDPFFKILGWDVNNEKGYAEAYKDVIHEDSIKVGGVTKAPDYCFRIGGTRKFFVETKKPSVNLKDDISPAFQLRRYAWSAKLPLSILTDFEEFAVYDCRVKPDKSDKSSTARILYLNCNEYAQRWDEIFEIFSRDAVLKGSFDRFAESSKVKKGTASVDDAFLKEIESWRDMIARSLALRNADLNQHDLNFAVQRTIDRIVFLRICEDRGIEQYGRLMSLQNGDHVYARLCEMFQRADERYNSGLFHFQKDKSRAESPDTLTLNVTVDDSVLKNIIRNLYYPDSPYEFSVLSADILGQVYEQFLGKVIRLTAGHRAVVEEKPEVRKAGGVYYTPTYIVDYIVKNTVGKLLGDELQNSERVKIPLSKGGKGVVKSPLTKGEMGVVNLQNPKSVSKLKILDPACGSGSFLLGAYQYLLDWHRDWYVADGPEKWATGRSPTLYQIADSNPQSHFPLIKGDSGGCQNISVQSGTIEPAEKSPPGRGLRGGSKTPKLVLDSDRGSKTGNWHLTTAERKRILLNNIYGVDIDPQAVEVTKLSLLLKVLEGESEQTLARQLKLFHERALPDLGNNIKCGNSLIGTDFYHTPQTPLSRGEKADSPLERGAWGVSDEERHKVNPFDWEKEFPEIMKPAPAGREQGTGGFDAVIGNPPYGFHQIHSDIVKFYFKSHYTASQGSFEHSFLFYEASLKLLRQGGIHGFIVPVTWLTIPSAAALRRFILESFAIRSITWLPELVFKNAQVNTLVSIIQRDIPGTTKILISEVNDPSQGKGVRRELKQSSFISAGHIIHIFEDFTETELLTKIETHSKPLCSLARPCSGYNPYEVGKGEDPDGNPHSKETVIKKPYHANSRLGLDWKPEAIGRDLGRYELRWPINRYVKYGPWFAAPRDPCNFIGPRLLVQEITGGANRRIISTYCDKELYHSRDIIPIKCDQTWPSPLFLLGIVNSWLITWWHHRRSPKAKKALFPKVLVSDLKRIPVPILNTENSAHMELHNRMIALVDQMLELHKQLASARTDHDKTVIQRQIDATDRQIDQLVYELYGLTEEEIKIVEEGSP